MEAEIDQWLLLASRAHIDRRLRLASNTEYAERRLA